MANNPATTTGGVPAFTTGATQSPNPAFTQVKLGSALKYLNRARDSGAPPGPAEYVTWVTTGEFESDYPDAPPFGGPLVDRVFWVLGF